MRNLAILAVIGLAYIFQTAYAAPGPNVIFILVDDQGY